MLTTYDILNEQGKVGVTVFKEAVKPYKATGRTEQSAYFKVEGRETRISLTIIARAFVEVMETGSKKAKTDVPSREMIDSLKPWAQARGIPEDAVWGIAKKLLKEGQKINRNVYSDQMNAWADKVIEIVVNELAGYAVDKMVSEWKK